MLRLLALTVAALGLLAPGVRAAEVTVLDAPAASTGGVNADAAIRPDGAAVVAYVTDEGLAVATTGPGGRPGGARLVASLAEGFADVRVVFAPDGRALVVWRASDASVANPDDEDDYAVCCDRVTAVVVGAGGRIGEPRPLSPRGRNVAEWVAGTGEGRFAVGWRQGRTTLVATAGRRGGFGRATRVGGAGEPLGVRVGTSVSLLRKRGSRVTERAVAGSSAPERRSARLRVGSAVAVGAGWLAAQVIFDEEPTRLVAQTRPGAAFRTVDLRGPFRPVAGAGRWAVLERYFVRGRRAVLRPVRLGGSLEVGEPRTLRLGEGTTQDSRPVVSAGGRTAYLQLLARAGVRLSIAGIGARREVELPGVVYDGITDGHVAAATLSASGRVRAVVVAPDAAPRLVQIR